MVMRMSFESTKQGKIVQWFPLPARNIFQNPQWMPETKASTSILYIEVFPGHTLLLKGSTLMATLW